MPRRTTRSTPKKKTSFPVTKQPTKNDVNTQPSTLGNIGQGMSLGAGAAIGSTMVHGALGGLLGQHQPHEHEHGGNGAGELEAKPEQKCLSIFKQYHECAKNNNDLNLCKPYIDFYTQCIDPNFNQNLNPNF